MAGVPFSIKSVVRSKKGLIGESIMDVRKYVKPIQDLDDMFLTKDIDAYCCKLDLWQNVGSRRWIRVMSSLRIGEDNWEPGDYFSYLTRSIMLTRRISGSTGLGLREEVSMRTDKKDHFEVPYSIVKRVLWRRRALSA